MNRPSEICTVGGTYQSRRQVPAPIGTNNLGVKKDRLSVKRLCKKNIAHTTSHNVGVCYPNPRAPLLQLLLLFSTKAVCGREVNRPSELCTVGGTYQQRRHVPVAIGTNKLGVKKLRAYLDRPQSQKVTFSFWKLVLMLVKKK